MESIYVLVVGNNVEDRVLVHMFWQRYLHQNAMDGRVRIELLD